MGNLTIDKEIHLVCVRATSFPDGIMAAYKKLEQIVDVKSRMVYGVSHGSDTGIIYRAAAEAGLSDEAGALGLESYTIRKGTYATETLQDFRDREHVIGQAFERLLNHPDLDGTGECIECYKSASEVTCMVRITQ